MVQTLIELFYDTDANGELIIAGDPDGSNYEQVKDYLIAVEHNMDNGVASTLYRVSDDAPASVIQQMVDASTEHSDHGIDGGIQRGLEIQPGTHTATEVDDLNNSIQNAGGPNLDNVQPSNEVATHIFDDHPSDNIGSGKPTWSNSVDSPGAGGGPVTSNDAPGKSFGQVMKDDYPSIGEGNWRCIHPDHTSPEINPIGDSCSLGHSDDITENEYAQPHRNAFDPTSFL